MKSSLTKCSFDFDKLNLKKMYIYSVPISRITILLDIGRWVKCLNYCCVPTIA